MCSVLQPKLLAEDHGYWSIQMKYKGWTVTRNHLHVDPSNNGTIAVLDKAADSCVLREGEREGVKVVRRRANDKQGDHVNKPVYNKLITPFGLGDHWTPCRWR